MKRIASILLFFIAMFLTVRSFSQPVVITPPNATIEPGGSVTLRASGATYYQWSPATGLSTTEGPVTVASPRVTTTYTCKGLGLGSESVVNGNFEQGNVGFTSSYYYSYSLWNEGTYYVDDNAYLHHGDFYGHGHGGGNFMIINGAIRPGTNVWTEQISVRPNKYYAFSTWVCTLVSGSASQAAKLQFSINGRQIGNVFSAPTYSNTWMQFYELWYSGNSTTATITILNQNTVGFGNDFGLDDISFCELVELGNPQCIVALNTLSATATADNFDLCEGQSTTLHAWPTGGSGNYTYNWSPANMFNNPNVKDPVVTPPLGSTTYTCRISDGMGEETVSVTILVHNNEEEHITKTICANETYDFYGTLVSVPGQYEHHLESQFGCDHIVYLNLHSSDEMAQIDGSHSVYAASNLINGIYRYTIDMTGIVSDIVWSLTNPDWQINEVDPMSCCVLVTVPGCGELIANFRLDNCGETERRFVINADFFAVEEHGVEANVYPNPTNGTITIEVKGIESVRLTNMMGQILDRVECDRSNSSTLNLNGFPPSVYLLEIETINGMVKRRVVVCR